MALWAIAFGALAEPNYVGGRACTGCHEAESRDWRGSHHDQAMQLPDTHSVLGDFNDAQFGEGKAAARFSRRDGRFFIKSGGRDYPVAFTFGVAPLQQYLIGLPGGRYQAFDIAWDSRARAEGGQKWFALDPGGSHWRDLGHNWNYMCAACHSTNVEKNYRPQSRSFATRWSDLNVSCEACHGPGSAHVAWAANGRKGSGSGIDLRFVAHRSADWVMDTQTGIARRTSPIPDRNEIEVCARCHARRNQLAQPARDDPAFLNAYRPALIEPELYFPDGQIKGEVYEYGSFLQSRMFAKGVSCGDCHDPHSLKLKVAGNGLCARCHAPTRFDTAAHHFHLQGSPGAQCIACHMSERTYMSVDRRRDHGFRLPRPDLSAVVGAPNACTECHRDRDANWAAAALRSRGVGAARGADWAPVLADQWSQRSADSRSVLQMAENADLPSIIRASLLAAISDGADGDRIPALARDRDPWIRYGAARAIGALPPETRLASAQTLLRDPLRAIRVEAAAHAFEADPSIAAEYEAVLRRDLDRPESRLSLAALDAAKEDWRGGEAEYREAIRLDPAYVPAYVNFADLLGRLGRDSDGLNVLQQGLVLMPRDAALHHAAGLALVRLGRRDEALAELRAAVRLAPDVARYAYVLGIALKDWGK